MKSNFDKDERYNRDNERQSYWSGKERWGKNLGCHKVCTTPAR